MLPVRLTESVMGRISPPQLLVVIPAHILGSMIGMVFFSLITFYIPYFPLSVFDPIVYKADKFIFPKLIIEVLVVFIYNVMIIILPELLTVNKLSPNLISFVAVPLSLISNTTFHPAALFVLWYVSNGHEWTIWPHMIEKSNVISISSEPLQLEYLLSPLLASLLAGLFCNKFFPDDPKAWRRSDTTILE